MSIEGPDRTVLRELHISGLGVLEDVELELDPGLNVLTGETGAGKTMITVGLALALGRRASASLVRPGARAARVEALFEGVPERVADGWSGDGQLVLARQVGSDGRSTARVGGQLAPVSVLADLGAGLVELHGQHQGLRLLSSGAQTGFLDRFAGSDHARVLEGLAKASMRLRALQARLQELETGAMERARELDLLAYQVREIEAVDPQPGERDRLEAEASRLAHIERLLELAGVAGLKLAGEGGGADALREVAAELGAAADMDPAARALADRAAALAEEASDLARETRGYAEGLQLDPGRLEEVRLRIAGLRDLERKYGEADAVLDFLEAACARRTQLEGTGDERDGLGHQVSEVRAELEALAGRVTQAREKAAPMLAEALAGELQELGMEGAEVQVILAPSQEVGPTGAEHAEFRFRGGPGQAMQPLAKVASGGELSRTMLACRSVLVDLDDVPTLVFDEVDQGIGGRAAVAVGRRLAALADRRQVVVVTHLPQIAAFADRQIRARKDGGTATVEVLDPGARVEELSRMLSGLPGSEAASLHAEELLAEAARAGRSAGKGGRHSRNAR